MSELRIFDTLSGEKHPLRLHVPGQVSMYVCGVTVYAPCHVGHARTFVAFDAIYRYLLHKGLRVRYVRNFTDVDDKIIRRANEEGVPAIEIANRYVADFHDAMDGLFLLRPDEEPRVTETMGEIVTLVASLIERGHAYVVEGDVYFDVSTKADYGKLSRRQLEGQDAGARVEVDDRKRHPFDFALWKSAKPGEPSWQSPWGAGRPGWHIECSAMSIGLLGEQFDLHGGGRDLIFPHHENELAQTEAATGRTPAVTCWMHGGHLTLADEKISKSLGNVIGIGEILETYAPEALRLFFLGSHYRSPYDYTEQGLREAEVALERLYATLLALDQRLGGPAATVATPPLRPRDLQTRLGADPIVDLDAASLPGPQRGFLAEIAKLGARVEEAMDDDFNTARALGQLHEFARRVNKALGEAAGDGGLQDRLLAGARHELLRNGNLLGLFHEDAAGFFLRQRSRRLRATGVTLGEIDAAIGARNEARARKDFAAADEIRQGLVTRGVLLKDGPQGTSWDVVS
jgi:cysteinyl-tRNA synthetase